MFAVMTMTALRSHSTLRSYVCQRSLGVSGGCCCRLGFSVAGAAARGKAAWTSRTIASATANFCQMQQLKAQVAELLPYKVKYEKIQATVQLDRQRQLQKQQQQKPGGGGDAT